MHTNRELIKNLQVVNACFRASGISDTAADLGQAEILAKCLFKRFKVQLEPGRLIGKNAQGVSELILGNIKSD